jgi:hypothetical protein
VTGAALLDPVDNLLRAALVTTDLSGEPLPEDDQDLELDLKVNVSSTARRGHCPTPRPVTGRLTVAVAATAPPLRAREPLPPPLARGTSQQLNC